VGKPYEERFVDVVLAEYNALRAEIVSHITVQAAVVGLGLTAIGVIVGLAANAGGDDQVLLIVPPLSLFVVLIYSAETYRSAAIEIYIYQEIWPILESKVATLPSWERAAGSNRFGLNAAWQAVLIDFPAMAVFVFAGVVAQLIDRDHAPLWWIGWGVTACAIVLPAFVGWVIQRKSTTAIEAIVRSGEKTVDSPPLENS